MRTKQPGNEEILKLVDNTLDGADARRGQNLVHLQTLQSGRINSQLREQIRLEKKYGSDHPRVQKIANRIQSNQGAVKELNTEVQRANITVPNFDPNTWMVHGQVIEAETGNPVQDVSVSLYDAQGKWVKELGYACTDEQGYYAIRYTREEKEQEAERESLLINTNQSRIGLNITVTDKNNNIIHSESEPVHIIVGQIDYRLIILKRLKCTPPGSDKQSAKQTDSGANKN